MGHTLPQYHVKHDFFETIRPGKNTNFNSPEPEWKYLAQLLTRKKKKTTRQPKLAGMDLQVQSTQENQVSEGGTALQEKTSLFPTETIQEPANPMLPLPPMLPMEVNQDAPSQEIPLDGNGQEPPLIPPQPQAVLTSRSGCLVWHPTWYQQSLDQQDQGLVGWVVLLYQDEPEQTPMAKQQYDTQVAMAEPLIYATSSNPDIMYLHEAMKAPDRKNFL